MLGLVKCYFKIGKIDGENNIIYFDNKIFVFWVNFSIVMFDFQDYRLLFEGVGINFGEKILEDKFFEYEVCYFLLLELLCYYYMI